MSNNTAKKVCINFKFWNTIQGMEGNCNMMKYIFAIILIVSVVFSAINGNMNELSSAALNSCVDAVGLFIYIIGGMCMWGGLMRVGEKSGITKYVAMLFRPFAKILFKGLDLTGKAFQAICMNVTANLLGLGNAATPLGMEAMHQLELEEGTTDTASRNMIVFTVLNTASITIVPTTAASLRLKHGSSSPMEIFVPVIITSLCALTVGLLLAICLDKTYISDKKKKRKQDDR